jgi:hypothetical protein
MLDGTRSAVNGVCHGVSGGRVNAAVLCPVNVDYKELIAAPSRSSHNGSGELVRIDVVRGLGGFQRCRAGSGYCSHDPEEHPPPKALPVHCSAVSFLHQSAQYGSKIAD